MIGKFPTVLNFNRFFLKLNWFICNYMLVLPDHRHDLQHMHLKLTKHGSKTTNSLPKILMNQRITLVSMDFSMVSSKKHSITTIRKPWPNAFDVNMPLIERNFIVLLVQIVWTEWTVVGSRFWMPHLSPHYSTSHSTPSSYHPTLCKPE